MYCKKCGKKIDDNAKFCNFCGFDNENIDFINQDKNKSTLDIFVSIYDSIGEQRDKYMNLSSNEAWELINRLGKNTFENYIEENRDVLNKQPYKTLEYLESAFKRAVMGGYWIWMADCIYKRRKEWKLKSIELVDLIDKWTKSVGELSNFVDNIPAELEGVINSFHIFNINSFLESSPEIKDLPVEFIDKLKFDILKTLFWGYHVGLSEYEYKK